MRTTLPKAAKDHSHTTKYSKWLKRLGKAFLWIRQKLSYLVPIQNDLAAFAFKDGVEAGFKFGKGDLVGDDAGDV